MSGLAWIRCQVRTEASAILLQVFENGASFVVASFDAAAAEGEGDLLGYMNELARLNSVPASWQLCKSTADWGQIQVASLWNQHCFDATCGKTPAMITSGNGTHVVTGSAQLSGSRQIGAGPPYAVFQAVTILAYILCLTICSLLHSFEAHVVSCPA